MAWHRGEKQRGWTWWRTTRGWGPALTLCLTAGCGSYQAPLPSTPVAAGDTPDVTAPIRHDPQRRVYIPPQDRLTHTMRVAVLYNDRAIQIRFEVPTDEPSWYHQYLVYQDGRWVRWGDSSAGPEPHGFYEDRIAVMFDDGSVSHFEELGGYVTMHEGVRSRSDEVDPATTRASEPGRRLSVDDIRKYLSESRETGPDRRQWHQLRHDDELQALREQGVFLDTWQWRAHRSHPIGYADNGYVLDYRHSAAGRSMYTDNWDDHRSQPAWMFDPDKTGIRSLRLEQLLAKAYSQDDWYYLAQAYAKPFDPAHNWQEGDALPHRFLQQPQGSRGSIRASGRWVDGAWRIAMTRPLEAIDPLDSKTLRHDHEYHVQFATHLYATGARWHYVSMPITLGLGTTATLTATYVQGDLDNPSHELQWIELPLHYPGQVTFDWLRDAASPLRQSLDAARANPLDMEQVQAFAEALVEHELQWLDTQDATP